MVTGRTHRFIAWIAVVVATMGGVASLAAAQDAPPASDVPASTTSTTDPSQIPSAPATESTSTAPTIGPSPAATSVSGATVVSPEDRASFDLTDVTAAFKLDGEELDHVLELRRAIGVSDDRAFVSELHSDPASFGAVRSTSYLFAGLVLTPNELPVAILHTELEWQAQAFVPVAEAHLGSSFAGSFIEGTTVVVGCAGCDSSATREAFAATALPMPLAQHIEIRQVQHSLAVLNALEARVSAYLAAIKAKFNGLGVFVMDNEVQVHVGPASTAGIAQALQAEFSAEPVAVVVEKADEDLLLNKNDPIIYGLVEGGQAIKRDTSPELFDCTSGFAVQGVYGPFLLTAGHCGALNQTWRQGGLTLGVWAAQNTTGYFDAALIE